MTQQLEDRFWAKVDKRGSDECWEWTGAKQNQYGQFRKPGSRKKLYAHRVSFEIHKGQIPDGMCILHRCDTPLCVNPNHLFLGTQAENLQDMSNKDRRYTKLKAPEVLQIRELFNNGDFSKKILGHRFGVTEQNINRIVSRQTWSHI